MTRPDPNQPTSANREAGDIYTTWACRSDAHSSCGGFGFRVIYRGRVPREADLPCWCACHLQPAREASR